MKTAPVSPTSPWGVGIRPQGLLLSALLFGLLCGAWPAWAAKEGSATLNQQVGAGRWSGVRLRRLPRGTRLALALQTDGPVTVLLVSEREYLRFSRRGQTTHPLFEGHTDGRLSFSVRIPESGDYYLVIDNRQSTRGRDFRLKIRATAPGPSGGRRPETPGRRI